jgi:hypothetical protein
MGSFNGITLNKKDRTTQEDRHAMLLALPAGLSQKKATLEGQPKLMLLAICIGGLIQFSRICIHIIYNIYMNGDVFGKNVQLEQKAWSALWFIFENQQAIVTLFL